jgi:ribonucleotide monophosphatase NagD (HAD superfamily)
LIQFPVKKFFLEKKNKVKKKSVHITLKGEEIERLSALQKVIDPPTQTEVIVMSLQVMEALIDEYKKGSKFYIQRNGESEHKIYDVFS